MLNLRDLCFIFMMIYLIHETSQDKGKRLEIVPERVEIVSLNKKYIHNVTCKVRKLSRRGSYVVNISGNLLHTWANNVSVSIVMYEYLHNEYKPTFVEFHFRLCDFINKDQFIGSILKKYGIVCPLPKGFQMIANGSMTFPSFPYVIPFTRGMAEVTTKRMEPTEELISMGHLYVNIKQAVY